MKNTKGYYNWIHQMNKAAIDSQINAKNMLTEAKAKKVAFDTSKFESSMPAPPVQHGKPDIDPNVVRAAAQVLGKEPTTPRSIELAGGDPAEYSKIRREKHAQKLQTMADASRENYDHDLEPSTKDMDGDGDVDVDDTVQNNTFKAAIETSKRPPSFEWAHRDEDEDEAADIAAEYADEMLGAGHGSLSVRFEDINKKISKMLNEGGQKESYSGKGRIIRGDDSSVSINSGPNLQGAPKGMFRGTESPSEKLGKILEIVRDGPEKHGADVHGWASSALETIQKQLRKG